MFYVDNINFCMLKNTKERISEKVPGAFLLKLQAVILPAAILLR